MQNERFERSRPRRIAGASTAAALVLLAACGAPHGDDEAAVQATSLLGRPLSAPRLNDAFREQQEALLAEALKARGERPDEVQTWIWVGRRTGYLGRYREAIEVYSRAIERWPDDPRLYRHRGHRYITVREFDRAIADLEKAAGLTEGLPDEIEPDGLPNARNIPTSTLQSNVWYHLGLVHYLEGDFDTARRGYRACLKVSTNPDMLCATSHWLYMTLRRLGRNEEARALLEPIHAGMDIIENHDYHRLLMMYRGERTAEELLRDAEAGEGDLSLATVAYGVGNWHLVEGRRARAIETFERIVGGENWAAFGFIAAEAELARMRPGR